jgi:hypothetical protein
VEITNQQAEIKNQQVEITNQQAEIKNQQVEITNQQVEIKKQQVEITNQQVEIKNLTSCVNNLLLKNKVEQIISGIRDMYRTKTLNLAHRFEITLSKQHMKDFCDCRNDISHYIDQKAMISLPISDAVAKSHDIPTILYLYLTLRCNMDKSEIKEYFQDEYADYYDVYETAEKILIEEIQNNAQSTDAIIEHVNEADKKRIDRRWNR